MRKKYRANVVILFLGMILGLISFFLDEKAFLFVDMIKNPFLDYLLGAITHFGSVIIVLIVMTTLFLWEERKREWIPVLWGSFIVSSFLCILLKVLVARARPFGNIILSFFNVINYSFPSLHATASFTAVEVLDREFPKFKWFWIIFAFVIAFSRVYLKLHYLSDVVFGDLLGYLVGFIFVYLEEKFGIFKRVEFIWKKSQKKK